MSGNLLLPVLLPSCNAGTYRSLSSEWPVLFRPAKTQLLTTASYVRSRLVSSDE
jgi:hypothetical protein